MDVAEFYQLSAEQLLEMYQVILKQAKAPFSYIQNKIPSYKNTEGKWQSLTGVDPYELAKEFSVDVNQIPLKLTDLEGLSVLADQRRFTRVVQRVFDASQDQVLGFSQIARQITTALEQEGFSHNYRVPLADKIEHALSEHGKDVFLMMRSLSLGGRWNFPEYYRKRVLSPEMLTDKYEMKNGSYVLNAHFKSLMVSYSEKVASETEGTPIYFIEHFHRLCARQGLSISQYVDDSRPEELSTSARHVLEKAFAHAKQNDWQGFHDALMTLELKLTPRISGARQGVNAIEKIRASLRSTPWQAMATTATENSATNNALRQEAIKRYSLQNDISRLYKALMELAREQEEKKALNNAWQARWQQQDLQPWTERDMEKDRALFAESVQEFSAFLKIRYEEIVQGIKVKLDSLPEKNGVVSVLEQQLSKLMNADLQGASKRLSRILLLNDWFSPNKIDNWCASNSQKQVQLCNEHFYQRVCTAGLAGPMGYTQKQFDEEDRRYSVMIKGVS